MDWQQQDIIVAAILAAAVELQDEAATVERYRKILAELRATGNAVKDSKGGVV